MGRAVVQVETLDMVLTALETLAERGLPLTLKNAIPPVDRHPRTVRRNFAAAIAGLLARPASGHTMYVRGTTLLPALIRTNFLLFR